MRFNTYFISDFNSVKVFSKCNILPYALWPNRWCHLSVVAELTFWFQLRVGWGILLFDSALWFSRISKDPHEGLLQIATKLSSLILLIIYMEARYVLHIVECYESKFPVSPNREHNRLVPYCKKIRITVKYLNRLIQLLKVQKSWLFVKNLVSSCCN